MHLITHKGIFLVLLLALSVTTFKANDERPRVVIMTDAETDDRCSMVHALLYADYDMEYFDAEAKHQYRDEHFEADKQMAFELGKNFC